MELYICTLANGDFSERLFLAENQPVMSKGRAKGARGTESLRSFGLLVHKMRIKLKNLKTFFVF